MKELKVGERVTITLEAIEHRTCEGCFFYEFASDIYADTCTGFKCGSTERKDGKNVIFKEVKK